MLSKSIARALVALSLTLVAIGAGAAASQASPRDQATSALLDAFDRHDVVAFGMVHGLRQQERFLFSLLRQARLAETVDSIVIEFGNARYQARADRYVNGGRVSRTALAHVWRDMVGAWQGVLDESPARFFAEVRRVNLRLPPADRLRVVLGDPAFDWRELRRADDLLAVSERRDEVFAAAAERELRQGRKVLLVSGYTHVARIPARPLGGPNAIAILERGLSGRVWSVLPYAGGARGMRPFERRFVGRWPVPVLRPLVGALGRQPANRAMLSLPGMAGHRLSDVADALVSFGRCAVLRETVAPRAPFFEPGYRRELDRRWRIIAGERFRPPPAVRPNAPYCPSATEGRR